MKKTIIFCLILIAVAVIAGVAINWSIEPNSKVHFKISGPLGVIVNGTLDIATAQINFDPNNLSSASLTATIKVNSVNTNNGLRDHHLTESGYFDAAKYSDITFKSTSVEKTGDGKFIATGNLTIRQLTKSVVIPFSFSQNGNEGLFAGSLKINRLDFGVGGKTKLIGDEVTIDLNIRATK